VSAHPAGAGRADDSARSARESHPLVVLAVLVALGALLIGGWFLTLVILALVALRRWDRRWTVACDAEAEGPRPGRCVAESRVSVPMSALVAERLCLLALGRAEPAWQPTPGAGEGFFGGRVRARVRRRFGRGQLVSLWVRSVDGDATLVIIEARSRVSSRLYDGGATACCVQGLQAALIEAAAELGRVAVALPPPPPPVPAPAGWRWWHVVVALALFRLVGYPFRWVDLALGTPLRGGGYLVVGQLFVVSLVLVWLGWVSRNEGTGSWAVDYGKRLSWPEDLFIGVPLAMALIVLESVVITVLVHATGSDAASTGQVFVTARQSHWVAFWPLAAYAVIGAPFVEELTFRGLTLRGMERKVTVAWAVVGSGALFGSAHWIVGAGVLPDLLLVTTLALVGMVLGVIAVAARRLGPSMVAHGTLNLVVTAVILVRYH
jgi:uncharacterized protein